MIAGDARMNIQPAAASPGREAELRAAAEAALRRELPLDSWFLFVEARPSGVRVSGLARAGDTVRRVRRALGAVPGIGEVETDLLPFAGWPRTE